MTRKVLTYLLLALGMLVLAACTTGGGGPDGGGPPLPDRIELEPAGETTPAHTDEIASGETHHFELDPNSVTGDLIVIELNRNLTLEQTTITGATVIATSSGPEFFAAGDFPPASAADHVDPAAIGVVPVPCRGSCIVMPASGNTMYFQVSGATATTDYSIYVYGDNFLDTNEGPGNDVPEDAAGYFLDNDSGAIETIGDIDWWEVTSVDVPSQHVEFLANGDLDLELFVQTPIGELGPYGSGEVVELFVGDLLRVESATDRAARGSDSIYQFIPVTPAAAGDAR